MVGRTLPDYENPPAVETALGLRFAPIPGWNVFHYGMMLERFRGQYPRQELKAPVGNVQFELAPDSDISDVPVRCLFINADGSQLLQVQNSCFIRNWRKTEERLKYLHYDDIRPLFERDWTTFLDFLHASRLSAPDVWQAEVTYINHFVRGKDWNSFSDLPQLYPAWKGLSDASLLARQQMLSFVASYALPDDEGSLQFASQPALRKADGAEIIQLSVTAFGRPSSSSKEAILDWLDSGRAAVVSGFTAFTSSEAHTRWGIK